MFSSEKNVRKELITQQLHYILKVDGQKDII